MKRIFVLSLTIAGFYLKAQTIGNSPYAAFGIGDVKYDNTTEINAMGGVSTAFTSDFSNDFNFRNPAANANLQLTSIKVEGTNENNFYKADYNNLKLTKHSTYLSNISIAFPLSPKLKFGLGYQPYSSKNYDVYLKEGLNDAAQGVFTGNRFRGEGSVNVIQGALSYNFSPELALGLRTNYYFGNITDINEVSFYNADGSNFSEFTTGYESRKRVSMFNFTLGSVYQKTFENDRKFTVGATATFGNVGNLTDFYTSSTYILGQGNVKTFESLVDNQRSEDKAFLPAEYSAGAGFGHDAKWFAGAQIDYKSGQTMQFMGKPLRYEDSYRVSAGGWFLPNYNNFRNYFSRVTYRYGAYYEKGNLRLNNQDINKYALTAGLFLPFATATSRFSGLDVGIEAGKRGTAEHNLVRQNFVNVRIGINFADKWFNKRYYD